MWIKLEVVVPEVVHQGAEKATWFHREEFSTIEKRKNKKKLQSQNLPPGKSDQKHVEVSPRASISGISTFLSPRLKLKGCIPTVTWGNAHCFMTHEIHKSVFLGAANTFSSIFMSSLPECSPQSIVFSLQRDFFLKQLLETATHSIFGPAD